MNTGIEEITQEPLGILSTNRFKTAGINDRWNWWYFAEIFVYRTFVKQFQGGAIQQEHDPRGGHNENHWEHRPVEEPRVHGVDNPAVHAVGAHNGLAWTEEQPLQLAAQLLASQDVDKMLAKFDSLKLGEISLFPTEISLITLNFMKCPTLRFQWKSLFRSAIVATPSVMISLFKQVSSLLKLASVNNVLFH